MSGKKEGKNKQTKQTSISACKGLTKESSLAEVPRALCHYQELCTGWRALELWLPAVLLFGELSQQVRWGPELCVFGYRDELTE